MKITRAILVGIGIWLFGVTFFNLSYEFPILENPEEQANTVLSIVLIPLVWLACLIYYKANTLTDGYKLGVVFIMVATVLDTLITVPLFIIPKGGSHYSFFVSTEFWNIALEIIGITAVYYYTRIAHQIKKQNQKASNC